MIASPLTNLLPENRRRILRREYLLRLGVVVLLFFSVLVGISSLLLLPSYLFLIRNADLREAELANLNSSLSISEETSFSQELDSLSKDVAVLQELSREYSVVKIIREVIAIPRPGITLSRFSYIASSGKKTASLSISGIAATRDALRGYQLALQSAPRVASAELPVSAYAKDADIAFTITIIISP